MRIALTNFHLRMGGQAMQVLLLATALRGKGHEVVVLSPEGSDLALRAAEAGLAVFTGCGFQRGFRPARFFRDLKAFCGLMQERGIELVHTNGSQDTWLAIAARKLKGLRFCLVRTRHNQNPVRPHWFNRRLYAREIARVVAISEPIGRELVRGCGVAPERIRVIHPGLPDDFSAEVPDDARTAVRREFSLPEHAILVGQVARLDPVKGQETLLGAFLRVREIFAHAHLLLVGTGGDYHRLLGLRDRMGLEESVHFTLFRADIPRLMAAIDVAVTASMSEGWGLSAMEAMLLEVPVVVTDSGGPTEVVEHGELGEVVPPKDSKAMADAIVRVIEGRDSPDMHRRLQRARRKIQRENLMSVVAAMTEAVYREALSC